MPSTWEIDREAGIVSIVASGRITPEEALATFDAIVGDPNFRPGTHVLSDHRGLETVVDAEFIRAFLFRVQQAGPLLQGSRVAFVESEGVRYGMARMTSILSEASPMALRAFQDIDEAHRWLMKQDAESTSGE
jgi:hypothetical protein